MMQTLIDFFTSHLGGAVSKELLVFIISMFPILELRGGIIASALLDIPLIRAIIICGIGNLIPVPFILLLITRIFDWLKGTKRFRPLVEKLEARAMKKKDQIEKYEFIGLILFVGIPLPGTGAWTGSLIASLLGMRFRKSFPAVVIGICLAMIIMTLICYLAPQLIFG